ncbi:MAG: hypothetical protein AAF682_31805 [Planctomycetota bacterium]
MPEPGVSDRRPNTTTGIGKVPGLAESALGGVNPSAFPAPDGGEQLWCCYAWPLVAGTTGQRVFFLNQEGVLLATGNGDGAYDGFLAPPLFDAALSNETGGADLSAPLASSRT